MLTGLLLNLTPGPDTFFILGRSLSGGPRLGVASALGITAGSPVHTVLAALGLSAALASSAIAFTIVKWAGAPRSSRALSRMAGAVFVALGSRLALSHR